MRHFGQETLMSLSFCVLIAALFCAPGGVVSAQGTAEQAGGDGAEIQQPETLLMVRTGSPQQTLQSWLDHSLRAEFLTEQAIKEQTRANLSLVATNSRRLLAHLDLSQTPAAVRNEVGLSATYALQDIMLRVTLPPMDEVPDWDAFDESTPSRWRLPGTPVIIARMEEGPRSGEFLISATTVSDAPAFYDRISHFPVQHPSLFESWTKAAPQLTGPLIPATLVSALPDSVKTIAFGTPT